MKKWTHSGSLKQELSAREEKHRVLARRAAAEGIVLLKNEGALPLDPSAPIALFGSGADKTVKGGIGSGDVNNRESISVYRGVKDAGAAVVNEDWIRDYEKRWKEAREKWKAARRNVSFRSRFQEPDAAGGQMQRPVLPHSRAGRGRAAVRAGQGHGFRRAASCAHERAARPA